MIPHMNKAKMECEGSLPMVLDVMDMAGHLRDSMNATIAMTEDEMMENENDSKNAVI